MKDVKLLSVKEETERTDLRIAVIYHFLCAAAGFITCKAVVFDYYIPFGISFAAGCSPAYLPSAAVGIFIGYFLPGISVSGLRYVAAFFAVIAVRFVISFNKKLNTNPLFAAFLSAVSLSVTSAVSFAGVSADVVRLTLEVLLSAAAAIVISRFFAFLPHIYKGLTHEELGCLLTVISIVLAGLYGVSVFGITLSGIAFTALILTAGKYGGMLSSTVSSIAAGILLFFAGRPADICLVCTAAAFISGLVISFGKYIQLCTFFTCVTVSALILSPDAVTAAFITETLIGCILFAVLPKNAGIRLGKIFTCFPEISVNNDVSRAAVMRLSEAAAGIRDVKSTVDEVAARLEDINTPGFSGVLSRIKESACLDCRLQERCWQTDKDATLDGIFKMIKQIRNSMPLSSETMPEPLKGRCIRSERFCECFKERYLSFTSLKEENDRIGQIRKAIGDQFCGIAAMLKELSDELSDGVNFDNSAALTAVCSLKNIGIIADECSAPVDRYGRMKLNLRLQKPNEAVLNRRDIMRALSLSCERNFAPPVIKKASGETFISISERPRLKIDVGVCQKSARQGEMCGDAYSYFSDGSGHFIIILSDGMGTGSRAAVDSAMASGLMNKLIKSGFGFDCALKILNSSMLFKSADESLATMDIAEIDLFSGQTNLFKAGAAPTLIRRSGHAGKAVSKSMPIGILSDVAFDKACVKLSSGDVLVLASDGATFDGPEWMKAEIEGAKALSAQELADRLCTMAANRRADSHADDITVIAATIS